MTTAEQILALHDAGQDVPTISRALDVTPGYVYGILREDRPKRQRKARTRTSKLRQSILYLHMVERMPAPQIVAKTGCSRQYVYALIGELAS